jgi:hypothetical protein
MSPYSPVAALKPLFPLAFFTLSATTDDCSPALLAMVLSGYQKL